MWTVPGDSAMAGVHRGREAIFRFLARLPKETDGTYSSRLVDVLASDERAAALYRASGERHGRRLDLDQVLLFRLEDGLVREVLALPSDPAAFEAFWARDAASGRLTPETGHWRAASVRTICRR